MSLHCLTGAICQPVSTPAAPISPAHRRPYLLRREFQHFVVAQLQYSIVFCMFRTRLSERAGGPDALQVLNVLLS